MLMCSYCKSEDTCNIRYPAETQLQVKSRQISSIHNVLISCRKFSNFAQSTVLSLLCSVHNFTMIWLESNELWANEFSLGLSLSGLWTHILHLQTRTSCYEHLQTQTKWPPTVSNDNPGFAQIMAKRQGSPGKDELNDVFFLFCWKIA